MRPGLVALTIQLETTLAGMPNNISPTIMWSPYRQPLARFLNKYAPEVRPSGNPTFNSYSPSCFYSRKPAPLLAIFLRLVSFTWLPSFGRFSPVQLSFLGFRLSSGCLTKAGGMLTSSAACHEHSVTTTSSAASCQ